MLRSYHSRDEMQVRFMPRRGTINAILTVRQMMGKYEATVRKLLYMVFPNYEKAFDCVSREVIRWALRRKGVVEREIKAIKEMYFNIKTSVKVESKRSSDVKFGTRQQGSVLSRFLFTVIIDVMKNYFTQKTWYYSWRVVSGVLMEERIKGKKV